MYTPPEATVAIYDRRGTDYGIESMAVGWLDRPDLLPPGVETGQTLCLMVWIEETETSNE